MKIDRNLSEGLESRDGRWIIVRTGKGAPGNGDILAVRVGRDTAPIPLVATEFAEVSPALSPDGHWLAYSSNESGRMEVYVRPFPAVRAGRWQISTKGGSEPTWAHSGKEIFYRDAGGEMVAAQVTTRPAVAVLGRLKLFAAGSFVTDEAHRAYDVSPDDQRFIMIATEGGDQPNELVLVENWLEELKAKMEK